VNVQTPTDPPDDAGRPDERQSLAYLADHLVVPDDISELDDEVKRWRHERKQQQRRARLARLVPVRWQHYGITAPLLVASMLLLGAFGAMLTLFTPTHHDRPQPVAAPLADPTVPPGQLGGLLPGVALATADGNALGTHALKRPAVVLLVPRDCADCVATVGHVAATAAPYAMAQYVVAGTPQDARRYAAVDSHLLTGVVDTNSALLQAYGATPGTPTLVVVGDDGTVRSITPGVNAGSALTDQLDKAFATDRSAAA
jgi:hypothetical protein